MIIFISEWIFFNVYIHIFYICCYTFLTTNFVVIRSNTNININNFSIV